MGRLKYIGNTDFTGRIRKSVFLCLLPSIPLLSGGCREGLTLKIEYLFPQAPER
jgi:hypothetical protein